MLNRKSKMVSFRLSPEEYRTFREACAVHGVGSISELARTAMQHLVQHNHNGIQPMDIQICELRERAALLIAEIDRIARQITP